MAKVRWCRPGQPRVRNAQATYVDGIRFPSKREANRWYELSMLEKAKEIRLLGRQVRFPLEVMGIVIGHYVADFVYQEHVGTTWKWRVEDAKGWKTEMYRWKKKHFEAQYQRPIIEV